MVYIIGHRGAMGYEPENTILSFQKALELKVDGIELDVRICKSGELVVIHDETVDRTTNEKGYVADLTLYQLKSLDAGKGERIPTLEEVLDFVDRRVKVGIELKEPSIVEPLYETIKKYIQGNNWSYDHFMTFSFYQDLLIESRNLNPMVNNGIVFYEIPSNLLEIAKSLDVFLVGLYHKFVTKELVDSIHENNRGVMVYPINDSREMDVKKMCSLRVGGIVTDYPDETRSIMNSLS